MQAHSSIRSHPRNQTHTGSVKISCALKELCCTTPCSAAPRARSALRWTRCRSLHSAMSPQRKQTVLQQTRPAQLQVSANERRPQSRRNLGLTGLTATAAAQNQGPHSPLTMEEAGLITAAWPLHSRGLPMGVLTQFSEFTLHTVHTSVQSFYILLQCPWFSTWPFLYLL